jgi:hypothetical protein
MEIVTNEPGRGLAVEETTPRMPLGLFAAGLVVVVLVATPWRGLWAVLAQGAAVATLDLAGAAVWLVIGLLLLLSLRGGSRIERISADRESGIAVRSTHLAGFVGWTRRIPPEALQGLILDVAPDPAAGARSDPRRAHPLRLRLTLRTAAGRRRPIPFLFSKVDRTSEVADLALRAGAAVGLPYYRVVASDAREFEIELLRTPGPDVAAVPTIGPADYAGDMLAPPATDAVADKPRRFDPSAFEGKPRVTTWEPGHRVRFEKPWSAAVLLSPLLAASLLGPLAWWRLSSLQGMPALPRIVALAMITVIGLVVAAIGWVGFTAGLPRRVTLDWTARSLVVDGVRATRSIPFSEIEAVELRARSYRSRRGQRQYTIYCWCEVHAILRPSAGPPANEPLAETRRYRENRVTPHLLAAPLATELAAALDVATRDGTGSGPESRQTRQLET